MGPTVDALLPQLLIPGTLLRAEDRGPAEGRIAAEGVGRERAKRVSICLREAGRAVSAEAAGSGGARGFSRGRRLVLAYWCGPVAAWVEVIRG